MKDYPENKLELIEEAVEQSIFDITPTMLFFDQFKFLQKNGQLLLLARFHREKKLEEIRNRMAHYCLSEKENDIDKPYEPFITLASAKLPSKQQYLHLKKKIERLNPEIEIRADKLEMVSFIEEQASSRYDKIATFELAE